MHYIKRYRSSQTAQLPVLTLLMTQMCSITHRAPTDINYSVAIYNPYSISILTKE